MIKCVKRQVDGDAMALHVLGVICFARVGLVSKLTIFGVAIYQRVDSVRLLLGITWNSHAA